MKYLWLWYIPAALTIAALLRVSAFRSDRPTKGVLGVPYLNPFHQFDPDRYTDAGKRLLRVYWVCSSLLALGVVVMAALNAP